MVKWLFAALLAVPLVDAAVLVFVGTRIGWLPTVLLVVLTAFLGALLVRAEGRRTLRSIQQQLARGSMPADSLIDGGLLIAAGALLLTPGLVTDLIGFLLAVPISRAPIRSVLKTRIIVPRLDAQTGGFVTGNVYTFGFPADDQSDPIDVDSEVTDSRDGDDPSRERNA